MSSNWQMTKLREHIRIKHGFAFKGEHFSDESTEYQLTTPGNFSIGGGFQDGKAKYYNGPIPAEFVLEPGDLLVTMTDLSKAADTLGYGAVVPHSKGVTWLHNQRVGRVQLLPGKSISLAFLHYLLRSPSYRQHVLAGATGSTVKHTAPDRILDFQFLLPPSLEACQIGELLGSLDDRIDLLRETNATLEAIAQALFKSWFVDFDPVRAKRDGRAPEGMDEATAALFPDSFEDSELGAVPRGWKVGVVLDVANLLSGGTPKTDRADFWGGEILWASAKDVSQSSESVLLSTERTITQAGVDGSATRIIPAMATVVVARGATTGRSVMFGAPMAMNQTCYALTSKLDAPVALNCLFRRQVATLLNAAHGSVFDTITTATFAQARCVHPPALVLQKFESVARPLFDRIITGVEAMQTLSTLRDTLLPRLISGQLRLQEAVKPLKEAQA